MLDKAAAKTAVNDDIGEETRLELYRSQVNIRAVSYTHLTLLTNREV